MEESKCVKHLKAQTWNWCSAITTKFYWLKEVSRPFQLQGVRKETLSQPEKLQRDIARVQIHSREGLWPFCSSSNLHLISVLWMHAWPTGNVLCAYCQFHSIAHPLASPGRSQASVPVPPTFKFHRHMSGFPSGAPEPTLLLYFPTTFLLWWGKFMLSNNFLNYQPSSASLDHLVSIYGWCGKGWKTSFMGFLVSVPVEARGDVSERLVNEIISRNTDWREGKRDREKKKASARCFSIRLSLWAKTLGVSVQYRF